jgi:radical SAM superfamily enzyme YgiQ (UPF0313 family)
MAVQKVRDAFGTASEASKPRRRGPGCDALLVGYGVQENLGLRSVAAVLAAAGYGVRLLAFDPERIPEIVAKAGRIKPRLIGLSIIFQSSVDDFARLASELRAAGVDAIICAGGHYPSLRPAEVLGLAPELDAIARFEGEETLLELMGRLGDRRAWGSVRNLAFRQDGEFVLTPLRPLIPDLDALPPLLRDEFPKLRDGSPVCAVSASRGCAWACSFCSVRAFYASCEGRSRRSRSPASVAEEMRGLVEERGVEVFLFQDDDFAARAGGSAEWLERFLAELDRLGLGRRIRWKISCRVDDLDERRLDAMVSRGLAAVYLGIESGSERGLRLMGKRTSVEANLRAIELVESRALFLGIGFMLVDPSSDLDSLGENIDFLDEIGRNGYFPLNFCKMLPYAGTRIEEELRAEGRLMGTAARPDYRLSSAAADLFEYLAFRTFGRRNFAADGLAARLADACFDFRMCRPPGPSEECRARLREINVRSNRGLARALHAFLAWARTREGADAPPDKKYASMLSGIAADEWRIETECEVELEALLGRVGTGERPGTA